MGEFYRDEVDAPSALLTRMRVAAQERGEAPLNAFSANKIMRDFGAVMSGTASKKKSRRAQGWDLESWVAIAALERALATPNPSVASSVP